MSRHYTERELGELRRLPIASLVGLPQRGTRYICPVCEKTNLRLRGASFLCFTGDCAVRGFGAIDWFMRAEALDFVAAVGRAQQAAASAVTPIPVQVHRPPPSRDTAAPLRLWNVCRPVITDAGVCAYLEGRALDPSAIHESIARALPPRGLVAVHHAWAIGWTYRHRLILPLYNRAGRLVCVQARDVTGQGAAKTLFPAAPVGAPHGAMFVSPAGHRPLRRASLRRAVFVEGDADFLTACQLWPEASVFGIAGGGSYTSEWGRAVASDGQVAIWTDPDPAGDAYAASVTSDVSDTARVVRPELSADLNDLHQFGIRCPHPFRPPARSALDVTVVVDAAFASSTRAAASTPVNR